MNEYSSNIGDRSYNNPGSTLGGNNAGMNVAGEGGQSDGAKRGHLAFLNANVYQAATLNKLLPAGFKIDLVELVQRNYETKLAAQKKAA